MNMIFTHAPCGCGSMSQQMDILSSSSSSSFSDLQLMQRRHLCVSFRYRKRRGGCGSLAVYAILFIINELFDEPSIISRWLYTVNNWNKSEFRFYLLQN